MIRIKSLVAHYGQVRALKGLSLHVAAGEIVTLIGANGAGKTTTLNVIAGMHCPTDGSIDFQGRAIQGLSPAEVVSAGISLVPEGRQVFGSLSVHDNLLLGAYIRRGRRFRAEVQRDLEWVTSVFPVLGARREQKGGTLSGGEQQMLAIGRALMARPRLLLLDEPSMGLAPTVVAAIFKVLAGPEPGAKPVHPAGGTERPPSVEAGPPRLRNGDGQDHPGGGERPPQPGQRSPACLLGEGIPTDPGPMRGIRG